MLANEFGVKTSDSVCCRRAPTLDPVTDSRRSPIGESKGDRGAPMLTGVGMSDLEMAESVRWWPEVAEWIGEEAS